MPDKNNPPVVCFGEILWDMLPSGAKPGGAPMNVAYHLKKLGQNPVVITRIGTDQRGMALKELLLKQDLSTRYLQEDALYPTGIVDAIPGSNGNMSYRIIQPVAWDYIQAEPQQEALMKEAAYFVFGSLAIRSPTSRSTLFTLLEMAEKKVLDINLRAPHYDRKILSELLAKADILKLNEEELDLVTGWSCGYKDRKDRINHLQDMFRIPVVIVTLGADGALVKHRGDLYSHPGFKVKVEDTVGSGDSFLAAFLTKVIENAPPQEALAFASAMGAAVASRAGAWPAYSISDIEDLSKQYCP